MLTPRNYNRSLRQRFSQIIPLSSIFLDDPFLRHFYNVRTDMDRAFNQMQGSLLSLEPFDSLGALTLRGFPPIHRDVFLNFADDDWGRKALDSWKDVYEADENGKVKFRLCYDVKGFPEENVKVTVDNRQLKVEGEMTSESGSSKSSSHFCRVVTIPDSVDVKELSVERTNDGVLVITAPVNEKAITSGKHLPVEYQKDKKLVKTGKTGLSTSPDGSKIHIEFDMDPGTKREDVRVAAQRFQVRVESTSTFKNETSEFKKTFSVSPAIDPEKSEWELSGNTFIFEAPFDINTDN